MDGIWGEAETVGDAVTEEEGESLRFTLREGRGEEDRVAG